MLETAPSFSIYSNNPDETQEKDTKKGDESDKTVQGSGDFTFIKQTNMDLIKEEEEVVVVVEEAEIPASPPMYLASGLGVMHGSNNEGFEFEGEENSEEYYMELLEEYPNHPLALKKCAQLLESKGDLQGAEYYYFRALQAGPGDAEVMSLYARLVWELHRDREKALIYFEHAAQASPDDSNVLAAYAKFLWEIDDDGEDRTADPDHDQPEVANDSLPAANTDPNETADTESCYKRMVEKNPSDPVALRTYAQFLYQSKGDLQGAEDYYSRAILADSQNGELLSQYAKLLWELYHDPDRVFVYFERAIQAAPGDSDVLAAYASFLWSIDDDEVDERFDSLSERILAGCASI